MPEVTSPPINLRSSLALTTSMRFPVQSATARREVLTGALWLLVPGLGWLLNMGHRIMFVHQMYQGQPPFPAWRDHPQLLKHGIITWLGMLYYYSPAMVLCALAFTLEQPWLFGLALPLWALATIAIPGYMTFYCRSFDVTEIFNPLKALSRVKQGGRAYWHAWGIVLVLLASSFLGLLGAGVGFLFTSVWFWQSAGFSFATVFTPQLSGDTPVKGAH